MKKYLPVPGLAAACSYRQPGHCLAQPALWARTFWRVLAFFLGISVMDLNGWADHFQIRSWYMENGLPDNMITAVTQTRDGYLWIGTQAGLVRFDGDHFKILTSADYAGSLEDSNIVSLATGNDGALWIASASGTITELTPHGFAVRYRPPEATPAYKIAGGNNIIRNWQKQGNCFAPDRQNQMWAILITGEVACFSEPGGMVLASLNDLPPGNLNGLACDTTGRLWLLKGNQAAFRDGDHWQCDTNQVLPRLGKVLCPAADGGFWTAWKSSGKGQTIHVIADASPWQITQLPIPTDPFDYPVAAIHQSRDGRLWLATATEGIYVKTGERDWLKVQTRGPLEKCSVRCLFEDENGSLWAGTWGEGLHQISDSLVRMSLLPPAAAQVHVTSVACDSRQTIWMGTDRGLYRQPADSEEAARSQPGWENENIYAVLADRRDVLWIGTKRGVYFSTNQASTFERAAASTNGGFLALFEDHAGNIWAGGFNNALYRFHDQTNNLICRGPKKREMTICCVGEDDGGNILALTRSHGLWRINKRNFESVTALGPEICENSRATGLYCDPRGGVWVSLLGNGVYRWYDGRLSHFTTADGLPDNGVLGLLGDGKGNLWMSSRNGILGCSMEQLAAYERGVTPPLVCWQVGLAEGMANRECTGAGQPVLAPGPDGSLLAATLVGAARFNPWAKIGQPRLPTPRLESVNIDGRFYATQVVHVLADARHFEFHYAAPELSAPQKLRFQYRLEGLETAWNDAGHARTAIYNRLPPGDYVLRVRASGEEGNWREANAGIRLLVTPFFYQTWWFQTLLVIAAIALISGLLAVSIRRRARQKLERLEAQRAVEQVRQRITRDLHDELGSAITEILQISDLSLSGDPGPEVIRTKMDTVTARVRQLSITVDEIVWTMSSRNDTLRSLAGYISNHAQEFFRHAPMRCRLDIATNIPELAIDSERRHHLFLATKEALNNAAKHSGASEVLVRTHYQTPCLRISVEDNGRGFDASHWQTGEGLANMRDRLQAIGGLVSIHSRPGHGTAITFRLTLPPTNYPASLPATNQSANHS
ncbi:MAG TPA: two-component regulator propeller domain-containing protein [Verrucomicrobiae bacterium]